MRIGELAKRTGQTTETIRFYERIGLLPPAARQANNYRVYGQTHAVRLDFIRRCRGLDISLEEIGMLLESIEQTSPDKADSAHALIHRHLEGVDRQIRELRELRTSLVRLAASCTGEHKDGQPCALLEMLADKVDAGTK